MDRDGAGRWMLVRRIDGALWCCVAQAQPCRRTGPYSVLKARRVWWPTWPAGPLHSLGVPLPFVMRAGLAAGPQVREEVGRKAEIYRAIQKQKKEVGASDAERPAAALGWEQRKGFVYSSLSMTPRRC